MGEVVSLRAAQLQLPAAAVHLRPGNPQQQQLQPARGRLPARAR